MKKILFALLLFPIIASAQQPPTNRYTPVSGGFNWQRGYFRGLGLPVGGTPALQSGQWNGFGQIRADSIHRRIAYWNGTSWISMVDTTMATGSRNGLNTNGGFVELGGATTKHDTITTSGNGSKTFHINGASGVATNDFIIDYGQSGSGGVTRGAITLDNQNYSGVGYGFIGKDPGFVRNQAENTITPTEAAAVAINYGASAAGFTSKMTNANIIAQYYLGGGQNSFADSALMIRTTGKNIQFACDGASGGSFWFKGSASNLASVYGGFQGLGDGAGGSRFGIGTMTPGQKLAVIGSGRFTDSLLLTALTSGSSSDSVLVTSGGVTKRLKQSDIFGGLASGTYSPTITAVANLDAQTVSDAQYMRVGNVVTVSGRVTADATAAGSTSFRISLPIASNLAAVNQLGGTAFATGVAGQGAGIQADATNDQALFKWVAVDLNSQEMMFTFTYVIL